jgi:hypothetical protein
MSPIHHLHRWLIRHDCIWIGRFSQVLYYFLLNAISIIGIVYLCLLLTYWVVFSRPPDFY